MSDHEDRTMPKTIWASDELKKWYRCDMQTGDTEYTRYDVHAEWVQAVGILSTLHPTMIVDVSDPLSMAKSIEIHVLEKNDLLEMAWGIIANASSGDLEKEGPEWFDAAIRWRDRYFAHAHPPIPGKSEGCEKQP